MTKSEWWRKLSWPADSGWAIVYITAAYVVVAILQFFAILGQARIAKRAIFYLERPWIAVTPLSLENGPRGNQPTLTRLETSFINRGRSTAFITESWISFVPAIVSQLPRYPRYPRVVERGPIVSLAPNESTPRIPLGVQLTAEESLAIAVNPKESTLMFFGYIKYRDVFRKRHYTRFCFFYFPPAALQISTFPMPAGRQTDGPKRYNRQT